MCDNALCSDCYGTCWKWQGDLSLFLPFGLSHNHLLHYYTSVIWPVLEYSAPVWHYALTKEQTHQIERIQKRAIHIIFNFSRGMPYTSMLYVANIDTLATRRNDLSQKFLLGITQPSSCPHYLLPPTRDQSVISRLRTSAKFPNSKSLHPYQALLFIH